MLSATQISRFRLPVALSVVFVGFSLACADETPMGVTIQWGVLPLDNNSDRGNGTILSKADGEEWNVNAFNAQYELGLLSVGDGSFSETKGFSTVRWAARSSAWDASQVFVGSRYLTGSFAAGGVSEVNTKLTLPFDWFGDLDEIDPDGEIWSDYGELWGEQWFAIVVREKTTGRLWRLSTTPGGSDFAALRAFDSPLSENQAAIIMNPHISYNRWLFFLSTDSKKAYFGAELPAVCAWQADGGVEASDLEGFGAEALALAAALGRKPAETASVELAVDEVVPAAGGATLRFRFDAVAPNGSKTAVSNLQYGATLVLERAETLPDLLAGRTVREAIDPSSGVAVLPAGTNGFARLHLSLP